MAACCRNADKRGGKRWQVRCAHKLSLGYYKHLVNVDVYIQILVATFQAPSYRQDACVLFTCLGRIDKRQTRGPAEFSVRGRFSSVVNLFILIMREYPLSQGVTLSLLLINTVMSFPSSCLTDPGPYSLRNSHSCVSTRSRSSFCHDRFIVDVAESGGATRTTREETSSYRFPAAISSQIGLARSLPTSSA